MSHRPYIKNDDSGNMSDLAIDAETLQGYKPCVNIVTLEDNNSTTAGTWLAKTNKVSALVDGQLFLYKITVAGASTTTLNITGSEGALGAKTVYRTGTTKLTTQYAVGHYILLAYNSLNTCFRLVNDYDANSYAYVRQYQHGKNAAGATNLYPILTRYNLTNKNGKYDNAYARFYTDTYIDVTNGYLYAPKVYSGGSEVAVKTDIPTNISVFTNDSGYITGITSSMVTTALGYTPGKSNFTGYTEDNKLYYRSVNYPWYRLLTPTSFKVTNANQNVRITDITVTGTYRLDPDSSNHGTGVSIKYNGSESNDRFTIYTDSPTDGIRDPSPRDIALLNVYINPTASPKTWKWSLISSQGFFIGETTEGGGWYKIINGTVTSVRVQAGTGLVSSVSDEKTSTLDTTISIADGYKLLTTSEYDTLNAKQGTVTSVRVQAGTGLSSSTSTAQTSTLDTTISIADGYKLLTTTEYNTLNDNRSLLHHDLAKTIEDTTTDKGWKMFNDPYNGFLLKSLRFQSKSPAWGVGDFGSGIVFGGSDTKGVMSLSYGNPQIKFAGGNGEGPRWWIGLTGTSATSYNLDRLKYTPTSGGTNGYSLKSNGFTAPRWAKEASVQISGSISAGVKNNASITLVITDTSKPLTKGVWRYSGTHGVFLIFAQTEITTMGSPRTVYICGYTTSISNNTSLTLVEV